MSYTVDVAQQTLRLLLPLVPNFLQTAIGSIDVAMLSDEALRSVGEAWTKALLENAASRRKQSDKP